ncbi:hypothetical protein [Rhizobium leguminosarum]|uniref:hypothetical protein n=1 Tax=Rhizobium leguminosarum TaxID=384 RepID=UPI0028C442AC|nr:hypothetical protein [Rhizobium leguminosarum]
MKFTSMPVSAVNFSATAFCNISPPPSTKILMVSALAVAVMKTSASALAPSNFFIDSSHVARCTCTEPSFLLRK